MILVTSKPHTRRVRATWWVRVGRSPEAIVRYATEDGYDPSLLVAAYQGRGRRFLGGLWPDERLGWFSVAARRPMMVIARAIRPIRRFASRSRIERRLLVRSFLLLQAIAIGVRLMPLVSLQRLLSRLAPKAGWPRRDGGLAPDTIVWAVNAVSRYVPRATCLARALAQRALLEAHGWPTRLCVGIGHAADGTLGGHAWIEGTDGHVLGGDVTASYARLLHFDEVRPDGD